MRSNKTTLAAISGLLFLMSTMTGCASGGAIIDGDAALSSTATPVLAEANMVYDTAKATLTDIASTLLNTPIDILFSGGSSVVNSTLPDRGTPEDRMATRRHALGLPDNPERRIAERQAAQRRELELRRAR